MAENHQSHRAVNAGTHLVTTHPRFRANLRNRAQPANLGRSRLRRGFPGLVLAILSRDRGPACEFHLVESDQRKASFLREASRVTDAPAVIHPNRAEVVLPKLIGKVMAVTARALAPLDRLLILAEPLLTTGAEGIFPKGETLNSEIRQALWVFTFESRSVPSRTDENGRILFVRELRRRAAAGGVCGDGT